MRHALAWRHVHFTGIGGVGMAGLALILRDWDVQVSGSDAAESKNLARLRERGATIAVGHAARHVTTPDVLVYSSAVGPENPERQAAAAKGIPCVRRGVFLAALAEQFPRRVAVAGSHGKTTTTAMLSQILLDAGRDPGYLVGGEVGGRAAPATAGAGELLVTEVDESDGTQAWMNCTHAIVVNAEDDHCWSVGGEGALAEIFRELGRRTQCLVTYAKDATDATRAYYGRHPDVEIITPATVRRDLGLRVPGEHNEINATLALRVALRLGVAEAAAIASLARFGGVERRLSTRYAGPGALVIEDYAHHPSEVHASLAALRRAHPGRRLRVIFQPHRNERVARFTDDFARELALADQVVVTPPFAAWVDDAGLADPSVIAARVPGGQARYATEPFPQLATRLAQEGAAGDVLVVMGAGTITELVPLLVASLMNKGL